MKVLFCSLAGHGFVFPCIKIALELTARGHECAFVTGQEYGPILAAQGLRRIERGQKDGPSFEIRWWPQTLSVAMQVKHIEYALAQFDADVIVANQLVLGGLIAGGRRDLPVCIVGGASYFWPATRCAIDDGPSSQAERNIRWHYDESLKLYNDARQALGLAAVESSMERPAQAGDLFLLRTAPQMVEHLDALPAKVIPTGACLWEPPAADGDDLSSWLAQRGAADAGVAYVQFGRNFDAPSSWPAVSAELLRRQWAAAVSCARFDAAVQSEAYPVRFFMRPHVMQDAVIKRSDVVIATGHPTATLGALTNGTPLILLPNGSGTIETADLYRRQGVGVVLDAWNFDQADVARAIDQILEDDAFRANAERVRSAFAAMNDAEIAADAIEALVTPSSVYARRQLTALQA